MQGISPTAFIEARVVGSDDIAEPASIPHEIMSHISEIPHCLRADTIHNDRQTAGE